MALNRRFGTTSMGKASLLLPVFWLIMYETKGQAGWKEIWSDQFSGTSLSSKNWIAETGTGNNGWGNQELQFYTSEPTNLEVAGGELRIIARKEEKNGRSYTSARIKTQDLKHWQYGRVEAKIKLPWSKGLWPAFWMLGQEISKAGWPKCGEIDVMEHVNEVPEINGTIHWDSTGRKYHGGNIILPDPKAFHLYAVEWDTANIFWLLDDVAYHKEPIGKQFNSRSEFHNNFFLLFNLAVGGDWPGSPDSSTVFPDTLHVDYVRVLKKEIPLKNKKANRIPSGQTKGQTFNNPALIEQRKNLAKAFIN
jgi:beta-glucanase (GH16 family)